MKKGDDVVHTARSEEDLKYPSVVVRTPQGACYVPSHEDIPDEIVDAIERWSDAIKQRPRRPGRCAEDPETCGKHSGIPPCCRAWWHHVWRVHCYTFLRHHVWSIRSHAFLRPRLPTWWHDEWGYIACPGCRQCGARVHVLPCPPGASSCERCRSGARRAVEKRCRALHTNSLGTSKNGRSSSARRDGSRRGHA
jgi:hypothetical protein